MTVHIPVLLEEAVSSLNLRKGAVVVDATLGGGGHSQAILDKIGREGKLVAIDLDSSAIEKFKIQSLKNEEGIFLINDNFSNLENILRELKIEKVEAILADFGWSSDQMADATRGMSFQLEAPLDMRLDQSQELTAQEVVNNYSPEELEKIIKNYGEERYARSIVRKIVQERRKKIITTTQDLAGIINAAVPPKYKYSQINPATRTFQAIRIAVNKELKNIEDFIPQAMEVLKPGGRLALISFHSLEDRIVKNIFRDKAGGCACPAEFPQCVCGKIPEIKIITKKPIIPEAKELSQNPRGRSAKLRVCEKL